MQFEMSKSGKKVKSFKKDDSPQLYAILEILEITKKDSRYGHQWSR